MTLPLCLCRGRYGSGVPQRGSIRGTLPCQAVHACTRWLLHSKRCLTGRDTSKSNAVMLSLDMTVRSLSGDGRLSNVLLPGLTTTRQMQIEMPISTCLKTVGGNPKRQQKQLSANNEHQRHSRPGGSRRDADVSASASHSEAKTISNRL